MDESARGFPEVFTACAVTRAMCHAERGLDQIETVKSRAVTLIVCSPSRIKVSGVEWEASTTQENRYAPRWRSLLSQLKSDTQGRRLAVGESRAVEGIETGGDETRRRIMRTNEEARFLACSGYRVLGTVFSVSEIPQKRTKRKMIPEVIHCVLGARRTKREKRNRRTRVD
ncbi:hypothetical protein N1851_024523 [Merluccius polli]|uniref:Uncharacterized protein n=1 Tax=Merluccius polli TaxID=89951 RepID=A0AA47NVK3_MERPO|nr:hypothetical protein N1851_024523 [Merluccius polli]